MRIKTGYVFDDVLLVPKHSDVEKRSSVDLSVDFGHHINKLTIPIVSANMKNVTGAEMADTIASIGGLPILHRFYSSNHEMVAEFMKTWLHSNVGCSVGVQSSDKELVDQLVGVGCQVICVDVAHGDHDNCVRMCNYIAAKHDVLIIAGNVATLSGALRLYHAGARVIKVGVGGGSLCTTRIETGNGVPQLTALEDVYEASKTVHGESGHPRRKFKIIADGGIRSAGDIVKALCFSDAVMLGNLLAGTNEAPGAIVTIAGVRYKEYAGSSTHKTNHVEGVSALVPAKGPAANVIAQLLEGVRSGLSYQGVSNLDELKVEPEFVTISNAGLKESHPHDVHIRE